MSHRLLVRVDLFFTPSMREYRIFWGVLAEEVLELEGSGI
jgi:hypothetical protein